MPAAVTFSDDPLATGRLDGQGEARAIRRDARRGGFQKDVNAILAQDLGHLVGDIGVLAREQPRAALDDRDPRAEAAEHLGELQPDIAATEHQQMLRYGV